MNNKLEHFLVKETLKALEGKESFTIADLRNIRNKALGFKDTRKVTCIDGLACQGEILECGEKMRILERDDVIDYVLRAVREDPHPRRLPIHVDGENRVVVFHTPYSVRRDPGSENMKELTIAFTFYPHT